MYIPDIILEVFLTTLVPGFVASLLAGLMFRSRSLAPLAILVGIFLGNLTAGLLPWLPCEREMSWLLCVLILSILPV
ncbi:MAG TPA: hypothetical protein PKD72_14705, partial [Gemmatales bacterium]|nr:hypothetical protein [Gemmatales bacterium]